MKRGDGANLQAKKKYATAAPLKSVLDKATSALPTLDSASQSLDSILQISCILLHAPAGINLEFGGWISTYIKRGPFRPFPVIPEVHGTDLCSTTT